MNTGFGAFSGNLDKMLILPAAAVCAVLLFLTTILMLWFALRRNVSHRPKLKNITINTGAEIVLIIIPGLLVLGMFYYGWKGYPPHSGFAQNTNPKTAAVSGTLGLDSSNITANDSLPFFADIHKRISPGVFLKRDVSFPSGSIITGPEIYFLRHYSNYRGFPNFQIYCLPE
ncbi:MAG: hypothetical protein P8184_18480 [Calditrichia bacterium]